MDNKMETSNVSIESSPDLSSVPGDHIDNSVVSSKGDDSVNPDSPESIKNMKKEAYKKFEEAAAARKESNALRKQVDEYLDTLKQGQLEHLLEIVPEDKLYEFAEKLLRKKIEWEESPADQKARIMAERERDKYKKELDEYSRKEQQQITQYTNQKAAEEIDNDISEVITELSKTHGKIAKSPEFVQDIARYMLAQLEKGESSVSAKKASEFALKSWRKRIGSYVNNISHDDLRGYLSKEQIEAIRKFDLDSALSQFPSSNKKSETGKAQSKKKQSLTNVNDYFNLLDKQYG